MAGARPDTWMPLYWGDYLRDTGHLSTAHHGAYLLLIGHYWSTGQPLPDDDLALWRIVRADSVGQWKKLRASVVALFQVKDGKLFHGRVEAELAKASGRMAAASAKAKRAAEARWAGHDDIPEAAHGGYLEDAPSNAQSNAQAMLEDCPSQPPSPSSSDSESKNPKNHVGETPTAPAGAGAGERGDAVEPVEPGAADEAGKASGSRKAKAAARGTRLPEGWQPGPELEQFAIDLGLDPNAVTAEFVDHWRGVPGQRGTKLDWPATYRNRCRFLSGRSVVGARRPQNARSDNGSRTRNGQASSLDGESAVSTGIAAAIARRSFPDGG